MKNSTRYYEPGKTITLYDSTLGEDFFGSLIFSGLINEDKREVAIKEVFRNELGPLLEIPSKKSYLQEFLSLINFSLLFKYLLEIFKLVFSKIKELSSEITQKFSNDLNSFSISPARRSNFISSKFFLKSFAAICLLISFLSLGSILLPLSSAQIYSLIQKSKAQEELLQQVPDPREAFVSAFEIDPNKEQSVPKDFKLFIPKIGLESDISPSVDLENEEAYKRELLNTGVAHAKGSYLPGQLGSIFLFAHSTDTLANISAFNAKFFSLGELQNGDEIKINYQGKPYKYIVSGKVIVNPEEVDLVRNAGNALILMTCTPPGTDWQRLIIFADQKELQTI